MPMRYGANKEAPTIFSLPPLSLKRFTPGLFVVLQEILYQPFFGLI